MKIISDREPRVDPRVDMKSFFISFINLLLLLFDFSIRYSDFCKKISENGLVVWFYIMECRYLTFLKCLYESKYILFFQIA